MKTSLTLALLGTGLLGRAIAERLQAVGHTVIAYNRTAAKALPLQAQGITVVGTSELAVTQAQCVTPPVNGCGGHSIRPILIGLRRSTQR